MQVTTGGTAEQLVVLGTAAGDVKAHSASSGRLLWRASAVSEGCAAATSARVSPLHGQCGHHTFALQSVLRDELTVLLYEQSQCRHPDRRHC